MIRSNGNPLLSPQSGTRWLDILIAALILIPLMFAVSIYLGAELAQESVIGFLQRDTATALRMIDQFASLYSAYAVLNYRREPRVKANFIAFMLILVSQLMQLNIFTIAIMFIYLRQNGILRNLKRHYRQCVPEKNYRALVAALFVTAISIIVLVLQIILLA